MFIDDPVLPNIKLCKEDVQFMKTTLSTGPAQVEIKFGSMQFDSYFVIIVSNMGAKQIAINYGAENEGAIYRRLIDTCGSHYVPAEDVSYTPAAIYQFLAPIAKKHFDTELQMQPMLDQIEETNATHAMRVNEVIKTPHLTDWFFHSK